MNNAHILGTERIGKLLVQYSIPAIIGMTITSLYNIIDSIFIGHGVGPMGIAGLAITFPLMNLVVAFCTMVSAGGSTISSIRLGQKDLDGATEVLGNTLMFCLVNAFLFGSISFIFLDDILRFFGASNETLPYARDFMQVILLGTPITYTMIGLNNIMRATGYPKKAMLTSMVTVVCNIILAPIFIFQFDWGIRGAATATVISQFIGMVWVVSHFCKDEYSTLATGILENEKAHHRQHPFHWYVTVPDERDGMCHRNYREQQPATVWWRHGYRSLRHHQPAAGALRNDCIGADDGNAADCRL